MKSTIKIVVVVVAVVGDYWNSTSRFLDLNIFWGSNLPQETLRGSRLWRSQYFPLLRNIRISTNTPSQTPPTTPAVSNKAMGIWGNEEIRREGQYRGIVRCKKALFSGEGLLTCTWIITKMNHPTLYKRWILRWHGLHLTHLFICLLGVVRRVI